MVSIYAKKYYIASFSTSLFFLLLGNVSAATLFFDPVEENVRIGSEFAVSLLLDTDDELINALEGEISYPTELLDLVRITDGDSVISLWIEQPSTKDNSVTFSGIIPGGFDGTREAFEDLVKAGKVITLVFKAKAHGEGHVSVVYPRILLNDGNGTPTNVSTIPFSTKVSSSGVMKSVNENDTEPPEPFELSVQKQSDFLNGKNYIVFNTQDKISGISHFEVCETHNVPLENVCGGSWVVAESPYVLKDQSLRSIIIVRAVDNALNERTTEWIPEKVGGAYADKVKVNAVVLVIAAIAAIIFIRRRFK